MAGYGEDLAHLYDLAFGEFARTAAPELLEILRRNGITSGRVVDLGCGTGAWARELTRAGFDVLGIDISASMIDLARRKAPEAGFLRASLAGAGLPSCDAVTSIGECMNSCDRKEELFRVFRGVHAALRPGGIFVFDIAEPGQMLERKHAVGEDWAVLLEGGEDRKRRILTRRVTTFRRFGDLFRRSEEVHRLRLYEGSEVLLGLRRAGFRARLLRGFGRCRLPRAHAVLLAKKH